MFLEKEQYKDDPVLNGQHDNPAIAYVWRLLNDYALPPTGGGGMGPSYHTQQDITHYQRNMREKLDPLFIRAVLMASRVRANARIEHEQELSANA
ncbi:MAG: hypothetical protein KAH44_06415 [Oricola sp.]|jgi:hypothetical protein|nr:hypothetical protein [Oricola sp.]